jgi:hypothetical protein
VERNEERTYEEVEEDNKCKELVNQLKWNKGTTPKNFMGCCCFTGDANFFDFSSLSQD